MKASFLQSSIKTSCGHLLARRKETLHFQLSSKDSIHMRAVIIRGRSLFDVGDLGIFKSSFQTRECLVVQLFNRK